MRALYTEKLLNFILIKSRADNAEHTDNRGCAKPHVRLTRDIIKVDKLSVFRLHYTLCAKNHTKIGILVKCGERFLYS